MRASRYRYSPRLALFPVTIRRCLVAWVGLLIAVPLFAAMSPDGEDPRLELAQSLAEQLLRVPSDERRSEILEEMIANADGHTGAAFVLRDSLIELWGTVNHRLSAKQPLRAFKKLLRAREMLDSLRADTLEIIRDKQRYPYPCTAPEATPAALAAFDESQKRIDESVDLMRGLWRETRGVRVPTRMHEHLDLAMWTLRAKKRASDVLGLNTVLPAPDLPPWVYGLPLRGEVEGDVVNLQVLGLSLAEQKKLAKGRAIRGLNERLLEEALLDAENKFAGDRIRDEFRQVAHTNNYRELFGLQALAWDGRLFEACQQHANYLWESGEFTHFQPEAEFRTFSLRAQRAGYTATVYENCHKGANDPFDVHDFLCHSSEHHRTILLDFVHEIATARSGLVWVQNYGLDTGFQSAIQWGAWRD